MGFYADAAMIFDTWRPKLSERGIVPSTTQRSASAASGCPRDRARHAPFEFLHGSGLGVGERLPLEIGTLFRAAGDAECHVADSRHVPPARIDGVAGAGPSSRLPSQQRERSKRRRARPSLGGGEVDVAALRQDMAAPGRPETEEVRRQLTAQRATRRGARRDEPAPRSPPGRSTRCAGDGRSMPRRAPARPRVADD